MMKEILLGFGLWMLSLGLVGFAGGCATSNPAVGNTNATATPAAQRVEATDTSQAAFRAELRTEPAEVRAGQAAQLVFTVKDRQGATVRDLPLVHEKPMHLLVVSEDLSEFYHIHPDPQPDGSYRVAHTFPNGGRYKLYADFTPPGSSQIVDRIDLNVAGAARERVGLTEDRELTKTVDGLRVTMRPDGALRAGQELMLNFAVADARSSAPVTDLQPYLGALAHFVIISEDATDFLHAHPMTPEEMARSGGGGGHGGGATNDNHNDSHGASMQRQDGQRDASPSQVAAHTSFPRAGLYKVWAQFQRNNQVVTVPFVVRVAAGEERNVNGAQANATNIPADAIRITVSSGGYEPGRINVRRGRPVRLAFYRADANNCGGEVVFPALNLRRNLPVGETTVVEVTPRESGELNFTCGMNMFRGALVVQ